MSRSKQVISIGVQGDRRILNVLPSISDQVKYYQTLVGRKSSDEVSFGIQVELG